MLLNFQILHPSAILRGKKNAHEPGERARPGFSYKSISLGVCCVSRLETFPFKVTESKDVRSHTKTPCCGSDLPNLFVNNLPSVYQVNRLLVGMVFLEKLDLRIRMYGIVLV